jgi:hypothetical protein
MKNPIDLAPHD